MRTSAAADNDAIDAATARLDAGGPGTLQVWDGTEPTHPEDSPTGTMLVEQDLSATAFAGASSRSASINSVADGTVVADGTPTYWRMLSGGGTCVFVGSASITGSGGEITYDDVDFVTGDTITLDSFTITIGEGT